MSCNSNGNKDNITSVRSDTVIDLSFEIRIIGQHSLDLGGSSFNPIAIIRDNVEVFRDTVSEYWLCGFESKDYPRLLQCSDGSVQILLEIDDRPNINYLNQITISNEDKVVIRQLPVFQWEPKDIDNDGKLEVSGFLTNSESIANGDSVIYNPKLVYEISNNCLIFDSITSIEINKDIYGKFYGFYYNEDIVLPYKEK